MSDMAGTCSLCGGPVFHRRGKPGEFDHTCSVKDAEIERLRARVAELGKENDFLRARAGNDDKGCVYCGLGASEQGKCASGFPGCARADDQMLCREAGVGMERDELRARVAELEKRSRSVTLTVAEIRDLAKVLEGYDSNDVPFFGWDDEDEYTIEPCSPEGVRDDDGSIAHYRFVAYLAEYPDEGVFGLGEPIDAALAQQEGGG